MHFGPLEIHDGKGRLQLCIHQREEISCWNAQGKFPIELISVEINHQDGDSLLIKIEDVENQKLNSACYGLFALNGFDYYFSFKFKTTSEIILISPIFRAELRADERILLFPAYNAFIYFEGKEENNLENVVPLRKSSSFGLLAAKDISLQLRIYDINLKALAVRAPQKVTNQLSRNWNGVVKISIDGTAFTINELQYLYHVPIIDKRSSDESFEKIGFGFTTNDLKLIEYIDNRKNKINVDGYKPMFEEFLKHL
jgi:hypothetical protein